MYTVKINWARFEENPNAVTNASPQYITADTTTLYIPADAVTTHGVINDIEDMKHWEEGTYFDYHVINPDGSVTARLIKIEYQDEETWYLASRAWLMGADGKTIEKLI